MWTEHIDKDTQMLGMPGILIRLIKMSMMDTRSTVDRNDGVSKECIINKKVKQGDGLSVSLISNSCSINGENGAWMQFLRNSSKRECSSCYIVCRWYSINSKKLKGSERSSSELKR